jgi:hypothetical protein
MYVTLCIYVPVFLPFLTDHKSEQLDLHRAAAGGYRLLGYSLRPFGFMCHEFVSIF